MGRCILHQQKLDKEINFGKHIVIASRYFGSQQKVDKHSKNSNKSLKYQPPTLKTTAKIEITIWRAFHHDTAVCEAL